MWISARSSAGAAATPRRSTRNIRAQIGSPLLSGNSLAINLATNAYRFKLAQELKSPYVFISSRHADRDVAEAVTAFLVDQAECDVYCSERDASVVSLKFVRKIG